MALEETATKKRKSQKIVERELPIAQVLDAFDDSQPREKNTFENPMVLPEELKEAYEEHKKKAGQYRPWVPPSDPVEDELIFLKNRQLRKRDLLNPLKNANLMPTRDVVEEKW